ncbi:MAG: hypothetical protein U0Q21_00890 [Dermatophilaceae bacterium]
MPLARLPALLSGVALALTLAACGESSADRVGLDPTGAPESPPGGSERDAVRTAFVARTAYDTCGKVALGQGETIGSGTGTRRCLEAALAARRGAELAVAVPTTEGDEIVHYVRVLPDGGIEVYVDPTADRFAGRNSTWSHSTCPAGTSLMACVPMIFGG